MKICFISHEFPPNIVSGCGTALNTLVKGLLKKGHEITIITPLIKTNKFNEKEHNLTVIRLPIFQSGFLNNFNLIDNRLQFSLALRKIKKDFDFSKFDILHIYDVHDSYFLDKTIIKNTKTIISVNDYYSYIIPNNPLNFPYKTPNMLKRYVHAMLTKNLNIHFLKKVDHIIANTNYLQKILLENLHNKNIQVIYRGMELKRFSISKNKYTSKKILYIGSNMERKGVEYLIRSMKKIKQKFKDAELIIIGKMNNSFKRKIEKIMIEDDTKGNIKILNYVQSDKIPIYFSEANVFVLPAIMENLAVTLLEAMASKTPVIATDVGGNKEALKNEAGIIISPKSKEEISSAIIKLFSNPKKAKELGNNGLGIIKEKFSDAKMISSIDSLYVSIVQKNNHMLK